MTTKQPTKPPLNEAELFKKSERTHRWAEEDMLDIKDLNETEVFSGRRNFKWTRELDAHYEEFAYEHIIPSEDDDWGDEDE